MHSQSSESSVVLQGPRSCQKAVLRDQYEVLRDIGFGVFGKIKLARHRLTGVEVVIKVLRKKRQNFLVLSEPEMMRSLEHPNVIQLLQVAETHRNIYMVMEHAGGGRLLDHVPQGGMQEEEARRLFWQVVSAVSYCHDKGIVHRDLKPENIMVDARNHARLIDFGFSARFTPGQKLHQFWGTLSLFAPEIILRKAYEGPPVDIWSLGVILHFMLTGRYPFGGNTSKEMLSQIMLATYRNPPCVSLAARMLICQMLTLDPQKRPTAKQILQHPWLTQGKQDLPHDYREPIPIRPDPEILTTMFDMGYDLRKTWVSLAKRKFNAAMATYLLLQHQKSQGAGCMFQGKPVPPRVKPCPHPVDLSHSPVLPKRSPSEPALSTFPLPCEPQLPEGARQAGQKHIRSASEPALHLHLQPAGASTPDVGPQPDSGQLNALRRFLRWVDRRIATCVRELCCCTPHVSNKLAPM
ncbi:sperm motility kinase 2B-like [Marmota marmota marmota]|uniref:sperm motility kinase 2B-like n=1 Tax=Marmota marmota marmota TaxID=9994 RepID=UPI0007625B8E|nr:sperm motility kinase 2B-like [Marmota marmota marmota]